MKLYTLLTKINNHIWPVEYGGTGVSNLNQAVEVFKNDLIDLLYPVGSIYTSTSSVSPSEHFGGEWQQLEDKFLFGAGGDYNVKDTGGDSTHILTPDELPSHTHIFTGSSATSSSDGAHSHDLKAGAAISFLLASSHF